MTLHSRPRVEAGPTATNPVFGGQDRADLLDRILSRIAEVSHETARKPGAAIRGQVADRNIRLLRSGRSGRA